MERDPLRPVAGRDDSDRPAVRAERTSADASRRWHRLRLVDFECPGVVHTEGPLVASVVVEDRLASLEPTRIARNSRNPWLVR